MKQRLGKLHSSEEWMKPSSMPLMILAAFMSGFFGKILGLGGCSLFGPYLLSIGVNPLVSGATCLYMIMYANFASLFMFLIFGRLNLMYTLSIALFTGIGCLAGLFIMRKVMKRYKRPSLIAFAFSLAILLSTLFAIYSNVTSLKQKIESGVNVIKGDPIC